MAKTNRSAAAPASAGETGFTLIELLVCLVLLAALSAIVVPRFVTQRAPTLEEHAQGVADDLARMRAAALGTGRVQTASSAALAATLPADVWIGEAVPGDLVFLPNGMSNGGVWLLEGATAVVALRVDWLTGRVTIDAP